VRALTKPPLLNWLLINFFKYDKKKVVSSLRSLKIKKLKASEKNSIYLKTVKNLFNKIKKNFKIKFGKFYFQFFFLSLLFHSSIVDDFNFKPFYVVLQQNIVDYIWFFFWKDISLNWTKYLLLSSINYRKPEKNFFFLQKLLHYLNTQIFQINLTEFWFSDNISLFNIFFFTLNISIDQHKKRKISILKKKKLFYYSLNFIKGIFHNKYEKIIFDYNRFLSLQTGVQKTTKYFVNRNYIFTTSTQLTRSRKIFFFKFFFKNNLFWKFNKYKERVFSKILDKKKKRRSIFTWNRSLQILPFFINKIFHIHNGWRFIRIRIVPGMVGYKLGQFSFSRKVHTRGVNLKNNFKNLINY
jgi:small subunit ribosomal protein S19